MVRRASRRFVPVSAAIVALLLVVSPASAVAEPGNEAANAASNGGPAGQPLPKVPVMTGRGGAVASVDANASQIGIDVLKAGGNAADAAIAMAAALGVTEPYSAGIGGGGFLVYYDAKNRRVQTIDGRETAPASFTETTFTNGSGVPLNFDSVVTSGLSVGVPGTPALWQRAARQFGSKSLRELLLPAERLAERGFMVDDTYAQQPPIHEEP